MSHGHERKLKDCLNCGTIVHGRFCQHCGQENVEPKESTGAMISHFFNDITHFDGKFFSTLGLLIRKPGFLSRQYMEGKRAKFLHPVRMYVFTSAIFFLLFFALRKDTDHMRTSGPATVEDRKAYQDMIDEMLEKDPNNKKFLHLDSLLKNKNRPFFSKEFYEDSILGRRSRTWTSNQYSSVSEYDSVQKSLPSKERDSWLENKWTTRSIQIHAKYGDTGSAMSIAGEVFLHKMPIMLIVSLPIFALILKLVYIRRKQFWYTDHAIFSVHQYIFTFILFAISFIIDKINDSLDWGALDLLMFVLVGLVGPIYLFISMRKFYQQSKWKTFFKFVMLNFLAGISLVILLGSFFLFSVYLI